MDRIKQKLYQVWDWVNLNRVSSLIIGVLGTVFFGLLIVTLMNGGSNRGDLKFDQKVNEALLKEQTDTQQKVQQDTGVSVDLPNRTDVISEVLKQYNGRRITVNDPDVYLTIGTIFGDDVALLAEESLLPDITLGVAEQTTLNLKILEMLGQSNYSSIGGYVYDVSSGLTGVVSRPLTLGYRYADEVDPVIVDDMRFMGRTGSEDFPDLFLNKEVIALTTPKLSIINPAVVYNGDAYVLELNVSTTEDMTVMDFITELNNLKIKVEGQDVQIANSALFMVGEAFDSETQELNGSIANTPEYQEEFNKLLNPIQSVVVQAYVGEITPKRTYLDLAVNDKKTILNVNDGYSSVYMR